jgi:hypothetical protein
MPQWADDGQFAVGSAAIRGQVSRDCCPLHARRDRNVGLVLRLRGAILGGLAAPHGVRCEGREIGQQCAEAVNRLSLVGALSAGQGA